MGTYLARPVRTKEREDGGGPCGLRYGAVSVQGWRISQEDAHLALPRFDEQRRLGLFGVFDGHRGGVVSRLVSEWLPAELRATPGFKVGDYPRALHEALLSVDRRLDGRAARREIRLRAKKVQVEMLKRIHFEGALPEGAMYEEALQDLCFDNPDDMGCTALVALLEYGSVPLASKPARLHVANVGDSRCVSWNAAGRAWAMSKDHKPRCQAERARVEAAGGWVTAEGRIEGDYNLSRALADFHYKRTRKQGKPEDQMISGVPEVRSRILRATDRFILLGCDGLWETRRGSQATVDALRALLAGSKGRAAVRKVEHKKLSAPLAKLLDATMAKSPATGLGMDNITAVLVQLPALPAMRPARVGAAAVAGVAKERRRLSGGVHSERSGKVRSVRHTIRKRPSASQ